MKTDIEISNETPLRPITEIAEGLGIRTEDLEPYGRFIAKVPLSYIDEEKVRRSHLILVTSISPTKAGIGKTTVSIGLDLGLRKIGKNAIVVLREPSLGPCFGMKGGACGGGYAQVLPMEKINLHFTGDFHAVTSAHNMITALMDNYLYQNKLQLKQTLWKRVLDVNDRALRQIITGLGPSTNGGLHNSGFDITPASEIMAILCLSRDLDDLRTRLDNILLGYKEDGSEFLLKEIGVTGSIVALLMDAMKPNLVQTVENTPAIIHGGPFANIAHGCNTLVATKMGLSLCDYVVTEAGFGADLGAEKFLDIKCRQLGRYPDLTVLVATCNGLKMHGGVDEKEIKLPNIEGLRRGFANLDSHIANLRKWGQQVVVSFNRYANDTDDEIQCLIDHCAELGVKCVVNNAFLEGGKGAMELAQAVVEQIAEAPSKHNPDAIYTLSDSMTLSERICAVGKKIYGADEVIIEPSAKTKLAKLEQNEAYKNFPVCVAKTQFSFSDDPKRYGRPTGFNITISDIVINRGSGFIVAIAGAMMRMPGLPKAPAALQIDVVDGKIVGLS